MPLPLHLDALIVLGLVIATCGLGVSQLCGALGRPHLLVVRGTHSRLRHLRVASWGSALAGSLAGWYLLVHLLSGLLGLVTFFGLEAIVLELCAQRILFLPLPQTIRPALD